MNKKTLRLLFILGLVSFISGVLLMLNSHLSYGIFAEVIGAMWMVISFGQIRMFNIRNRMH
jgi:uncharacterized membrane protein HdeD (DUF308 family)